MNNEHVIYWSICFYKADGENWKTYSATLMILPIAIVIP